jgi:hypothetical protein
MNRTAGIDSEDLPWTFIDETASKSISKWKVVLDLAPSVDKDNATTTTPAPTQHNGIPLVKLFQGMSSFFSFSVLSRYINIYSPYFDPKEGI